MLYGFCNKASSTSHVKFMRFLLPGGSELLLHRNRDLFTSCMSSPVAHGKNGEGVLLSAQRTRSLDVFFLEKEGLHSAANGEVACPSSEASCLRAAEFLLPNGESYSGTLLGHTPEGAGKYIWSDGCIYDGEWKRGMRHGHGKLQFSSGAVYEGEFSGGYMHGEGSYTWPGHVTYKGRWRLNLKNGMGYQEYANGDIFEGFWMQGTPDGHGKYSCANGNVYVGDMKGGKMSGCGTFTWTNGDIFEGRWLDGMMHGFGVYTWSNGSCYIGMWTRGLKDGKGTFYPNCSKLPAKQELYLAALRKRGLLPDLEKQSKVSHIHHASSVDMGNVKIGGGHRTRRYSSDNQNVALGRHLSLEVSIEKVMGYDLSGLSESISGIGEEEAQTSMPILEREYMQGVLINEVVINNNLTPRKPKRKQRKLAKDVKKPGEAIIKGHRSYDLMLSLQLGIRYTVGKITPIQKREVRGSDFGPQASFWMNFPKNGSQLTPPHKSEDFKWKDYCPMVFRNLREMFKIDAATYMISICGNATLRELSSPGKSGSVFFMSQDDRFMIKTLRQSEVKVLLRMLPDYYSHVSNYDNTLITKFFGLHRITPPSGQKFRFVVMGNMFCTELRIHRRFDLKGSSLGRSANKVEIDENTILKDLDLNYSFYLEPSWQEALLEQIKIDSKFLEDQNIMDYSLLLGVHCRAPQHLQPFMSCNNGVLADGLEVLAEEDVFEDDITRVPQSLVLVPRGIDDGSVVVGPHIRGSRLRTSSAAGAEEVDLLLPGRTRLQIQLGVNMPARAEHENPETGLQEVYDVVLYLGIIDILQAYNMTKKLEHAYKSIQFDSLSISSVDPMFYSQRFLQFIEKVFPRNGAAS
ncbi:hypothetical protein V2J09_010630 [Rumex salicifolius]